MAPITITIASCPSVSPMPLYTVPAILSKGIPSNNPVIMDTTKKARKAFTFPHDLSLQLTADAFNLINKNNTLDVNLLYTAAGTPTAASDPRQFQFGARLSF